MKKSLSLFAFLLYTNFVISQEKFDFSFPVEFDGRATTCKDFEGKPMILDFFGQGCIVCFKEMPKLNELYAKYSDSLSLILVGDNNTSLPKIYEKFREKYSLKIPATFSPGLHNQFKPPYTPFYIWFDKSGKIVGSSDGELVKDSLIRKFLREDYSFFKKQVISQEAERKSLIDRERDKYFFTSGFSKPIETSRSSFPVSLKISEDRPYLQFVNCPLLIFFKLAWFGQISWTRNDPLYGEVWPIVETEEDISIEDLSKLVSYLMVSNSFRTQKSLRDILQQDLARSFGITAYLYETEKPCWVIRRVDTAGIVNRANYDPSKKYARGEFDGFSGRSCSFSDFLSWIEYTSDLKVPLIDRTGITYSIDMDFSAIMTDWNDVVKSLTNGGFSLNQEFRRVQILRVCKVDSK